MIELCCQHCGHHLKIPDKHAGQSGTCKNCGKQIVVPAVGFEPAPTPASTQKRKDIPYKWIGATAGIVAVLAVGAFLLFGRDGAAPPQAVSEGKITPVLAESHTASVPNETITGRTVTFPTDRSVGMVILTNRGTLGWNGEHVGEVRGSFHVPPGKELGLWVRKEDQADLSFLKDFGPDDLDFLYLHHPKMTDDELRNVVHLTGLNALAIQFCDIGDSGLRILSGLTQLEDVGLVRSGVSDAGLEFLTGFTRLKGIHVAGTQVTERGLRTLKPLQSLTSITLSTNMITPPMVDALKEFSNLRGLYMNTFGENEGEDYPLSPEAILLLKDFTQLEELVFWGELIDDSLVPSLSQLTFLKRIEFRGTFVTQVGRNKLRSALPNCEIVL